jgi:hypothetical protein
LKSPECFVRLDHVACFIVNADHRIVWMGERLRAANCVAACAWLVIRKPHSEAQYVELAEGDIAKVLAEFQAIGEDPEKFKAFVNAAEARS